MLKAFAESFKRTLREYFLLDHPHHYLWILPVALLISAILVFWPGLAE